MAIANEFDANGSDDDDDIAERITAAEILMELSANTRSNNNQPLRSMFWREKGKSNKNDGDDDKRKSSGGCCESSEKRKRSIKANTVQEEVEVEEEEDEDDDDMKKKKKKKKKKSFKKKAATTGAKKEKIIKNDSGPMPPADMPQNVKEVIDFMGGVDTVLIIQKRLTHTDVGCQQNSMSIPFAKLFKNNHDFLTEDEKEFLSHKDEKKHWNCIKTWMLDTRLAMFRHVVPLRKWAMAKDSGASTEKYVLNSPWIKIVGSNKLKAGNIVQLWAFRVDGQLNLALVKIVEEE